MSIERDDEPLTLAELCSVPTDELRRTLDARAGLLRQAAIERGSSSIEALVMESIAIPRADGPLPSWWSEWLEELELRIGERCLAAAGTSTQAVSERILSVIDDDNEGARIVGEGAQPEQLLGAEFPTVLVGPRTHLARLLSESIEGLRGRSQRSVQSALEALESALETWILDRFRSPSVGHLGSLDERAGFVRESSPTYITLEVIGRAEASGARTLPARILTPPGIREEAGRLVLCARIRTKEALTLPDDHEWSLFMTAEIADHACVIPTPALRVEPVEDRYHLEGRFFLAFDSPTQLFPIDLPPESFHFYLAARRRER